MTAHAQKPDSVFQRNGRVHLYRRGCQFSRVLAFMECGSVEKDCSNTGWTVPSQAEDCWLPTPFASFPFTSPPVRRRVPPDSVSTLPQVEPCFRTPSAYVRPPCERPVLVKLKYSKKELGNKGRLARDEENKSPQTTSSIRYNVSCKDGKINPF